ncbi:Inter-alpha-trypsin inhibitor heavy chain H1 [Chionoecetes opilio]|uniref:Inter-alpha-trypsin inhibitor heavy chain H1 n=1 Tax=Chionoecetes opilio TaxID=41210 RepID=A0A8J4YK11_CHIOP|nr:Inter-alpha-trypsin inhibitor heavy chain H1 [Chionoecetes opilio]
MGKVVFSGQLREGVREVHPIVAGRGKEGPLQLRVSRTYTSEPDTPTDNHVERLWAYLSVQDLLDALEIVDDRNLWVEMRARVEEIAVRYQFVTKLTTLKTEGDHDSQAHPGLKSGSRHQKSRTVIHGGLVGQDLALLSPSAIAETLPAPLSNRIYTDSPTSMSFGDNDPHFVVQVPGMSLPFCFDIHASSGSFLSLIRDPHSGVVVNGQVTAAVGRPGNTYFTTIFISLAGVNFTITTTHVAVSCLDRHGNPTVDGVSSSLWPLTKEKPGKRKHRRRKESRAKRKSHRRRGRRFRGGNRRGHRAAHPRRHYTQDRRRRRKRRTHSTWTPVAPRGLLPIRQQQQYIRRRRSRSHPFQSVTEAQASTYTHPTHAFLTIATGSKTMPHPMASPHTQIHRLHPLAAAPQTIAHPQSQGTNALRYQSFHNQHSYPSSSASLSRQVRQLPHRPVLHPQAGQFMHPQAGVDISLPRFLHGAKRGRYDDKAKREEGDRSQLYRECSKTMNWKKISARRYGRVMVTLRNHRKLDFLLGDVDLSLVVTRTRSSHGQHFLGVYLEKRSLLSPNTTGIIGQFVYKTVGTVGRERPIGGVRSNNSNPRIRLAVVQPGPQRTYQVSEVNAFLSSRRSLLHKTHISCLYIKDQGRGLVAGTPQDYLRPCLAC